MLPLRDHLPAHRMPVVSYSLIAVNVAVFIWERWVISHGIAPALLIRRFGLIPNALTTTPSDELPRVLSAMFLHDPTQWFHIAGNVLFLWVFGDAVEAALGRGRFLAFYLACGALAAAGQVMVDPSSTVPTIGASGAISGVLAAYGSIHPRAPITVVNPLVPLWFFFGVLVDLPAWLIILEYFVLNLASALLFAGHGGVAFYAHLGGFVAGTLLIRVALPAQPGGSLAAR